MNQRVVRTILKLNLIKGVAAVGLLLLLPSARAQFTLPIYEPFSEYTNTTYIGLGDSAINWNFGNTSTNPVDQSFMLSSQAAMSYPALAPDTNANPVGIQSIYINTTSADHGALFSTNSGNIYVSFLLNYLDNGASVAPPGIRTIFNLVTGATISNTFTAFDTVVALNPDYSIMIDKNLNSGGTYTAEYPLSTNVPHLIVFSYQTNSVAGAPDTVRLWVDPTPFGNNAAIPTATLTTTNGANITNFDGFLLSSRKEPAYYANAFYIDEIRLSTNWAGVTPLATPAPGPLFTVKGGGASCGSPEDVFLSGSVATNSYLLYTNGAYAGVTLAGTGSGTLDFGLQTTIGYYSVLASNLNNGNVGWMTNSATVAILQPPVIATQPAPVVAATNNRAGFTATVTGNNLTFQWYKDGTTLTNDSHLSGATTNALVISPVTTADMGNYYAFIKDGCDNTTYTTTNSLSLDAPNNLVWYGDNFGINIWDLATSSEWNNGTAVFDPGDNVTFDDTLNSASGASKVTLTGVLTPTSIYINNSAENYIWTGSGFITGSASLVKSGSGTLIVSDNSASGYQNTYTGGTVINNGTLDISNSWVSLGGGPVTLAGGTLETYQKGSGTGTSTSSGLTNNVFVTANSTWQVDRTGNQCAGLVGALNGNPGTTLSLTNSATTENSQNWIRFGGAFTNNSAIVVTVNSIPTNSPMYITSYNGTNGAQIYNGAISGRTGFLVENTGSVYLNGANTYLGPTTNALGFLAGNGSVSGILTVASNATLGAGTAAAIGTFTVNSNLALNGNVFVRVNKSLTQPNDIISVTGVITNGGTGTVTVTNIGVPALALGDSFQIFSGAVSNGTALTVTGGGVTWTNKLAVNGSIQVLFVTASYPTNISFTFGGGTLALTWPATHLGWILQSQTNSLSVGIIANSNAWHDITSTASVTSTNIPVNQANPTVFYRLRHP